MSFLQDILTEIRKTNRLVSDIDIKVNQILIALTPPPAVRFQVTLQGATTMAKAAGGKLKLNLQDDGTGLATLTPIDAQNLPTTLSTGTTVPVFTSSDTTAVVVDQSGDATGLTAVFKPATPPKLATGVTLTATATDPSGKVLTGTSEGINVVAGPAGSFVLQVA